MRCDYIIQPESSIETSTSADDRKPTTKTHSILKYKQMADEFDRKQREESSKLAKDYNNS